MAQLKDTLITGDLRVTGTIYGLDVSTISSGVLPVPHGGTGMTTSTNLNAVVIGNSSSAVGPLQTVQAKNGAFYSTGTDVKPSFGTLPVAQGGTGQTSIANIQAGKDANGATIHSTYLKLSGGTMTGSIVMPAGSSAFNDTSYKFANGSRIGENTSGGLGLYAAERLYLRPSSGASSSGDGVEIDTTALYPTNNNSETLGKSGNKWSNVYATKVTLGQDPTADLEAATKQYVDKSFAANDAMIFKGTLGTSGTITALPATHNAGWTYRVITAGTYAGIQCEVGDLIICTTDGTANNNAHWTVAQTNLDGAVTGPASSTDNAIARFDGTTGKIIQNSLVTIDDNGKLTTSKAIHQAISGTGVAGSDGGASASPNRYKPSKWVYDTGSNANDGDIYTVKVPVVGHDYGVYMSVNNSTNYYPVVANGTGRITTHYPVNTYITVIFESAGSAASMYALDGSDARATVTGGVFRVLNYYDSNSNTYDLSQLTNSYLTNGATLRLPGYSMFGFDRAGNAQAISLYTAGDTTASRTAVSTTRVYNTTGIDWTRGLWYTNINTNYATGASMNISPRFFQSGVDLRYTDNCVASASATTLGMVVRKPVYFKGVIKEDGLFYLAPDEVTYNSATYKRAWTQDIPSSALTDGTYQYVYWLIGYPYYNSSYANSLYQIDLVPENKMYWYQNGRFEEYVGEAGNSVIKTGLEIKGHIAGDSGTTGHGLYSGGAYHNAYNNIILHGDATTGTSGIAFISDKGNTSINQPSDRGFIQFHSYNVTTLSAEGTAPTLATSGEANKLVIGVGNDNDDMIYLQTPSTAGLRHISGTSNYVIPSITGTTTTANYPLLSTTTAGVYANNTSFVFGTGQLTANGAPGQFIANDTSSTGSMFAGFGTGHQNHGLYSQGYAPTASTWTASGKWMIYRDASGNVIMDGNASTATKLASTGTTAKFWRGDNAWSDTISGGLLKITNNSTTLSLGAANTSWVHFTNSAGYLYYFDKQINAVGGFKVYNTTTALTDNSLTFSQGGGWNMSDSTWIRTVGNKSVYQNSGTLRTDGTLQVGSDGNYLNINSSGIKLGSTTAASNAANLITVNGHIVINASKNTSNSYSEGLRINVGSNNWTTIALGGDDTTTSGTAKSVWLIGAQRHDTTNKVSNFYISNNGSNTATMRFTGHVTNTAETGWSIRPRLSIADDPNTNYNLYVNGTGALTNRLTMVSGKPINQLLTGSGTAAGTSGSNYLPAKWTFNTGANAADGDIFTIKIPVVGHDYGTYMSVNNGTNYYPVVTNSTNRVTGHFQANDYLTVIFESGGSAASMFPLAGGTSRSTITGGVFKVLNYYDSGNSGLYQNYNPKAFKIGSTATTAYDLLAEDINGLIVPAHKVAHRVGSPIYIASSAKAANATGTWWDMYQRHYNMLIRKDGTNLSTTSYKPIYLKGTIANGIFTPDTTTPYVMSREGCNVAGAYYMFVGDAQTSTSYINYNDYHPYYYYDGTNLLLYSETVGPLSFASGNTITGNGSTTSFAITHAFNTRDVIVQVYDLATYETVECNVVRTNTSTVTVTFATAPAVSKTYRVLISSMTLLNVPDVNNDLY